MADAQAGGPVRPSWVRRAARVTARVGAALAILLVLLYATRTVFLLPLVAGRAAAVLEERSGVRVTWGELGGDLFGSLEVRDLRLEDPRPEALAPRAEVGWLRVRYDLWALARGELAGLTEVEASRARVELRPGGATAGGGEPRPFAFPDALPRVRLRDVAVRFDAPAGWLRVAGADLDLAPRDGGGHALELRASDLAQAWGERTPSGAPLEARLALDGSRLELDTLLLGGVERARASWLGLERAAWGELEWGGELALSGGRLTHAGGLRDGLLQLDLRPLDVQLGPVLAFVFPQLDLPDARLDGGLGLELDTRAPADLALRWGGEMEAVRWRGRELDRLEGEAEWRDGALAIARLEAARGEDRLRADDVRLAFTGGPLEVLRDARGRVHLESSDLPELLRGVPDADALTEDPALAGRVPAHRLELDVALEPGELRFERGTLSLPDGSLELQPGSLRWGEQGLDDAFVDVDLALDVRDLAGLARLVVAPRTWSGSLQGRLDLHGPLRAVVGELDVTGSEVVAAGLELGEVRARADVDRQRLTVQAFESDGRVGHMSATGGLEFEGPRLRDVVLQLEVPDLAPFAAGRLASGTLDLTARLEGAPADPRGTFELEARELGGGLLEERRVGLLALTGRLDAGRVELERAVLDVDGVTIEGAGTLAHTDFAAPFTVDLARLDARRGELDLALVDPVRLEVGPGRVLLPESRLVGSAGDLRARVAWSGGDLELDLRGERLDPMPLLAPFVEPEFELSGVACDVQLARRGGALTVEGKLDVARAVLGRGLPALSLDVDGRLAGGRATLERFLIDAGPGRRLELGGEVPLDPQAADPLGPGPLALRGSLDLRQLEELPWERLGLVLPLAGDLGLDLDVSGDWGALTGGVTLRGERLAVVSPRSRAELFGPAHLEGRLEFDGDGTRLRGFEFRAPDQAAILAELRLGGRLRPRAWWNGDDGGLREAALAGSVSLQAAELALVARLAPSVRRLGGLVTGDVTVAGTPAAPELDGVLEVRDGQLRLTGDVPSLMGLSARLEFTHERLRVADLQAEIGGGPLEAAGEVDWSDGTPIFDLTLTGSEVLLVQRPEVRLRSDVQLAVRGPLDALTVEGELGLREGRWSKRIEFYRRDSQVRAPPPTELTLFSFPEPPLSDMGFDVRIRSLEPFVVANNIIDGELDCDLRLGGSGREPDLVGSLFVGETRVSLPAARLVSQGGTVRFERDDPLVPQLDVRFTTRTRGYDVSLRVLGTSLEPEVQLSSSPPLTEEDLLLLVLTGKMPTSAWSDGGTEGAVESVAFYIGKDILQGWFGDDSEGESFFDRIDWRTGVDVTSTGAKTSEFTFRLSGPQSGRGRRVLLRAEQDIYDRANFGVRFVLRGD